MSNSHNRFSNNNPDPSSLNPLSPRDIKAAEALEASRELLEIEADREFSHHVLNREINWKGYEENKFLTQKELGLLLDYDKQSASDQADVLAEKGQSYASLFVKCLDSIRTKETVEYLIVLVDQLLLTDPRRAMHFHSLIDSKVDPFQPFLRILETTGLGYHNYTINRTSHILSILLSTSPDPASQSTTQFLRYLINNLKSPNSTSRDQIHALNALKPMLTREKTQLLFEELDGLKALATILNKDTQNAQLIYSVGFSLWLCSYSKSISKHLLEIGIIRKLVYILKVQIMEKVIRIIFATLKNLLIHGDDVYDEEMIGLGLNGVIETLNKRKFKDADIQPDMNFIQTKLIETIQRLSSFELYSSEVFSGALTWSPAHKNEVFWRENIAQFEQKQFKIIAKLIELLADEDENVREIACYDLGEFARFHSEGKRIITKLGGKPKLMINLQSKNPKLAKAALLATQKLMVQNWEFLAKSSAGGVASLVQKQNK